MAGKRAGLKNPEFTWAGKGGTLIPWGVFVNEVQVKSEEFWAQ